MPAKISIPIFFLVLVICSGIDALSVRGPHKHRSECCRDEDKHCKQYRGNVAVTISGRKCQRWDRDSPHHRNPFVKFTKWTRKGYLQKNFCRNPINGETAWCYTQDPSTRWEYCDIPRCSETTTTSTTAVTTTAATLLTTTTPAATTTPRENPHFEVDRFHIRAWDKDDWILLQQRNFNKVDVYTDLFRNSHWKQYKNGFGDPKGSAYWMGLEKMHQMTSCGNWDLLVTVGIQGHEESHNFVIYSEFKIESEQRLYRLNLGSVREKHGFFEKENTYFTTKHLLFNNKMPFTTIDRDHDNRYNEDPEEIQNCAYQFDGGWWHNDCYFYSVNNKRDSILGDLHKYTVTETQMAIRRVFKMP